MACTLDELLGRLDRVKATGRGHEARCPAHEDRKASLSIGVGAEGRLLLKCFAGCDVEAIAAALGLAVSDFFAAPAEPRRVNGHETTHGKTIDAVYPYRDETGALLLETVRFVPKDFRQRRPTGAGRYAWNADGVRKVLYRLDRLVTLRPAAVFIVEGERDVETLEAHGLPATTNVGGAGKWTADYADQLKACGIQRAALLPDADEPGQKHAHQVATALQAAGIVPRIVALPGLAPHGDVTDYFRQGGTVADLLARTKATAPWAPADPLGLVSLERLLAEPDDLVDFLVQDRLPCGSVGLIAAKPKAGKSTLARTLAFAVATGTDWLGHRCRRGQVVYLAFEDKRSEVKKHFLQLGAEGHESLRILFGGGPADLMEQLRLLLTRERIDLLIVDTVQRLLKLTDTNDYAEVTKGCDPLIALARELGTCVLLVHHAGKGDRTDIDAVMGSTAWAGAVDNIFLLKRTSQFRFLATIQRIGPDLDDTVVKLNPTTGEMTLGGSRHIVEISGVEQAMLAELDSAGVAVTRPALLAAVSARRSYKLAALKALLAAGTIERVGKGTRNAPFSYVRVPGSSQTSGIPIFTPVGSVDEKQVSGSSLIPIGPDTTISVSSVIKRSDSGIRSWVHARASTQRTTRRTASS